MKYYHEVILKATNVYLKQQQDLGYGGDGKEVIMNIRITHGHRQQREVLGRGGIVWRGGHRGGNGGYL